ncbi:hypothetical protein [Idiomarina zobellii]|uniref:DUF4156 domain-containing protein n=1 Tax=Idiomarina zobellii TaxID=86103 RepID=A0A837NGC8_9GAMM|nr:hypothetical protein [Idiomarina zobellii]KPD24316.1 hypothetical protein AFK76_04815 [Idiomarina zobellii]SDF66980.1 hypothetical protein SAMN04515658_103169 [Idiomarina zobellii]
MRKLIAIVVCVATLYGCASSGSSSKAAPLPIKLINSEMAKDCTFVGVSSGHVYNAFQYTADNINDARLKAAEEALASGANSAVITSTDVENPGHNVTVHMETYNCSKN